MDSRSFFRALESQPSLQPGSLHGLQGLNGFLAAHLLPQIPVAHLSKLAREESLLEAQVIQIILSDSCEERLRPNSRRSVSVGGHSICVVSRDDVSSGYRIWEWHGHILMYDEERGYTPEYIYGNFFQPLQSCFAMKGASNGDGVLNGVGLSSVILKGGGSPGREQVVHRASASSHTKNN